MKTFLGYKDEQKDEYSPLNENLPILTDSKYEPILITTKQVVTSNEKTIQRNIIIARIRANADFIQDLSATIMIIPGAIVSILYILNNYNIINFLNIPLPLLNITFWIALFGGSILWYQSHKQSEVEDVLIPSKQFTDREYQNLIQGKLGLSRFKTSYASNFLTFKSQKYLAFATKEENLSTFILLTNLLENEDIVEALDKMDIEDFPDYLEKFNITDQTLPKYNLSGVRSLLIYASEEAVLSGYHTVRPIHLFISLFKVFPVLKSYLQQKRLTVETMRQVALWQKIIEEQEKTAKVFNPNNPYRRTGGILDSIIYGYTYIFNHYSRNLNRVVAKEKEHFGIGHEEDLDEMMAVVSKMTKNNAIIVGENGTGKTSMILGLAERINTGNVPDFLKNKRILQLDVNGLIAASAQHGGIESVIKKSMEELQRSGDTILFIDEMQEIISTQSKESKNSIAGILLPYIIESKYPVVGTMSFRDYKRFTSTMDSMGQHFHIIEINEVTPQAAFQIILSRLGKLEKQYQIEITFPAIMAGIQLSQRYIHNRKLPDSAVSTIETACAKAQADSSRKLTAEDIANTVTNLTSIPVGEATKEEADRLLKLEERIKNKVIGQDEAVHEIVEVLKRARADVRDPSKPIGTFLFLGPTGVGKTYLAKTLNTEYFGTKEDIIRLDMSEYKEKDSVDRLIGSSDNNNSTTFLDKVSRHPYSVILLDEIEKAHPEILDLFLQVLDEGRMTNSNGETIDFNNSIIISTSNIGSKYLLETLQENNTTFDQAKAKVLDELKNSLRVEFINRFDHIVVFTPHDMGRLAQISILLLKELESRLSEKGISLKWGNEVPRAIAEKSRVPGMGARPLRRYIQEKIEGIVATKLLNKELKSGDEFTIEEKMIQ